MIAKITIAIPVKEITKIITVEEITKENITIIKKNITTKAKIPKMKGIIKTIKKPVEATTKKIITQAVTRKLPTKIMIIMIKMITKIMTTKIRIIKENTMITMTIMIKAIKRAIRNMIITITKTSNQITRKMKVTKINQIIKKM